MSSERLSSQFINLQSNENHQTPRHKKPLRKLGPLLAIALVAGMVWSPASASCARVKIEISATVSLVDDPDNLLHNTVAPGDIITGIYTYDSFAVDSNPLPQVGDYYYRAAPNGIRLKVNGLTFCYRSNGCKFPP